MINSERLELIDLLLRWQRGEVNEREVQDIAEELFEQRERPDVPETDDRSIADEVLTQLDAMSATWIIQDDIPAFLDFLRTPEGGAVDGWKSWKQYWSGVDFEPRRR